MITFYIFAIATLVAIVVVGTQEIISTARSIRCLEYEYHWRTKGDKICKAFDRAARAAGAVGVSMDEFVQVMRQAHWTPVKYMARGDK